MPRQYHRPKFVIATLSTGPGGPALVREVLVDGVPWKFNKVTIELEAGNVAQLSLKILPEDVIWIQEAEVDEYLARLGLEPTETAPTA